MRKPFECEHPEEKISLRRRTTNAKTYQYGYQCGHCGGMVGQWVKKERIKHPEKLPEWDHNIQHFWQDSEKRYLLEYFERRIEADGVAAFASRGRKAPRDFWEVYNEYLQTPEWANKRSKVLERAKGICEGCGNAKASQVHHLNYDRVGKEMLFDLAALCIECHDIIHAQHDPS